MFLLYKNQTIDLLTNLVGWFVYVENIGRKWSQSLIWVLALIAFK